MVKASAAVHSQIVTAGVPGPADQSGISTAQGQLSRKVRGAHGVQAHGGGTPMLRGQLPHGSAFG